MNDIISRLKANFKSGNTLIKLIYLNVGLFIFCVLLEIIANLMGVDIERFFELFEAPSNFHYWLYHPWCLLTYMFMHAGVTHILFNMIALYWFGSLFLKYYSQQQLVATYVISGLGGAIIFALAYNIFPLYADEVGSAHLLGASASIMGITIAAALRAPNVELRLLFLGNIKVKWLAAIMVAISFFGITKGNAGGEISHLGGALFGYLYVLSLRRGLDLGRPVTQAINWMVNLFKPHHPDEVKYKPVFRSSKHKKRSKNSTPDVETPRFTDEEYNKEKAENNAVVDAILEKVKRSGYDSLSEKEKRILFDRSKNL